MRTLTTLLSGLLRGVGIVMGRLTSSGKKSRRQPVLAWMSRVSGGRSPVSVLTVLFILVAAVSAVSGLTLRSLARQYAQTAAVDQIRQSLAAVVSDKMRGLDSNYFVVFEKDGTGGISAITTNTPGINALSAELIQEVADAGAEGRLDLKIPVGNLTGSSLLAGRGPEIPVRINLLTAASVDFSGELVSAGINQTKHRMTLTVSVDANLIIPWGSVRQEVTSELLVAETVVVGKVPDSYINLTPQ